MATQADRQGSAHLPPGEGSSLAASQAGSQASQASQAGSLLPSEEGSNLATQATQAGRQATPQVVAHLPPREGSNLATQVGRPVTCFFPEEEGSLAVSPASQAGAHLPPGAGSNSVITQAVPPFPGDGTSSQAGSKVTTHTRARESSSQAGNNLPTSQAGSQGTMSGRQNPRCSTRQRALQASWGNSTASQADSAGSQESNLTPNPPNRPAQMSSPEDPNLKWVINLSSKPLTPAQRSVLAKGPNFALFPKQPPNLEYITAIEAACTKFSQQDAEELRAEVSRVLRSSPQPNLTKAQNLALRELKRDRNCIVLTADKGVAMVIMDRQDYINKANSLLNQNTYRSIPRDPTNSIKNKLISILKRVKNETGLDSNTYKSMYPQAMSPKFYGLLKIHKPDTPLRPIMASCGILSSCGSVTYGVAKELAKILKPLVGKSPHHINSTKDFVEQAKHITLAPGECLGSYDVSALFTSVPVDLALNIIKDLLVKDHTLKERTYGSWGHYSPIGSSVSKTYFSFQNQFYEQVEAAAMGSPISPIVANLYMEYLEQKALSTAPTPQVLVQVCG